MFIEFAAYAARNVHSLADIAVCTASGGKWLATSPYPDHPRQIMLLEVSHLILKVTGFNVTFRIIWRVRSLT